MLVSAPVNVVRLLSFLVLAAALLAVQGGFGGAPTMTDRIDLPSGHGDGHGDDADGDRDFGTDLTLPHHDVSAASRVVGSLVELHRAPATAPRDSRIFRPPISCLA